MADSDKARAAARRWVESVADEHGAVLVAEVAAQVAAEQAQRGA
jgi:hypothetical protein